MCQCPSVPPISATYQCQSVPLSVLPISATYQCQYRLSVRISASQCRLTVPVSAT
ncbi:unnamed protein product [Staurois parvus]|uniref:Uncharacterized protein n=1 Tax=Staurois parvus TaxID=386267 RepID=A0ABN9EQF5_9NEOB|nr:unnamed protein product [Staurois parvus]